MPAIVGKIRIACLQLCHDLIELVLDGVGIDHGVFGVVVVHVRSVGRVVMDEAVRPCVILVVGCSVEQNVQAPALPCGYRYDGYAEHFRQAVQVYFHAPLGNNVHHVQGEDNGPAKLQKLQGQVEAALKGRGVHHVDDDVHVTTQNVLTCNPFLHGVGCQAVGSGQIHQVEKMPVLPHDTFHLLHCHAGPVGYLELGSCVGVEECGLAAVGVADKADGHLALLFGLSHCTPRLRKCCGLCSRQAQSARRAPSLSVCPFLFC